MPKDLLTPPRADGVAAVGGSGEPEADAMRHTAVLLGHQPGALRSLRRANIPAAVVDDRPAERGPAPESFFGCPRYDESCGIEWIRRMRGVAEQLSGGGCPVLFPTSDRGLLAIRKFYEELGEHYVLAAASPEAIDVLTNKVSFALWAQEQRLPIPASSAVRSLEEMQQTARDQPLPCIVKPDYTFQLERLREVKLLIATTRAELVEQTRYCLEHGLAVLWQSDLSPHGAVQWSLAGVGDRYGRLVGPVLSAKLRQVRWGAGTAVETMPMDEQVLAIGQRLCEALAPLGLFEMELRRGPDGAPLVIEVNPRIWSQVRLPTEAGINLLERAFLLATHPECAITSDDAYKVGVGWLSWRRDLRVVARMLLDRRIELPALLGSLSRVRVLD